MNYSIISDIFTNLAMKLNRLIIENKWIKDRFYYINQPMATPR